MPDKIRIEVLADGTVKTTTDQISPANHQSADNFMKGLLTALGGNFVTTKRKEGHSHTHTTQDQHQ